MKVNKSIAVYLLGIFISLACFQISGFEIAAPLPDIEGAPNMENPNDRLLQEVSGYALLKQWQDNDMTYHYVATAKTSQDSYQSSPIVKEIHMIVTFHDPTTFRVKILDNANQRWEIPEMAPFPHFRSNDLILADAGACTVEVMPDPFTIVITRKDTGEILFDTRGKNFVYSDLYIELTTTLPTDKVYGFGERNYKFKLDPGVYTIWGRDDPKIMEDGSGGKNTYGHHPMGLYRDKQGYFFITLMRNSNAMDVIVNTDTTLTYKMVGGVIDLIFFIGDKNPETVVKAYHNYLGGFTMMPFWSLGYHQSKWGYMNHGIMESVVRKYIENDIPLDVIWSDIDYMVNKEIFTIDEYRYPRSAMRELTTKYKKKWVPIIDPGVKQLDATGPGADVGVQRDIFLKNSRGDNLVGSVWPGRVYFPDFFNPQCDQYWSDMLNVLYEKVPFAGIWLDMNEVANFVDGEEERWTRNKYDNLPYTPSSRPLKRKTISLDAVHYGGAIEYDTHGLFSLMENAATHKFLETKSKLPFILTRSTSMGVGRYSAHWTGDNGAHWEYLQVSIPGNFNFQIFGIPFVGADICGFMDDTNEELCARWTQLGALYPFARNHHEDRTRDQEPWTFGGNNLGVSIIETTRIALKTRYSTLKWYYSLFIATNGAGSIFRPLMFEFQEEPLFNDGYNDWEFLLGKSVLCTPKVEPGEPIVNAYFPFATWFNLFTGDEVINQDKIDRIQRVETPFNAPVPHFLRDGHIVHRQKVEHVLSTEDLNDEFELIVGLQKGGEEGIFTAHGSIMGVQSFDDNSIYHRCMEKNCLYDIGVTVVMDESASAQVEITFKKQSDDITVSLDSFGIYGLRLYGLPLTFISEDEKKLGYALVEQQRGSSQVSIGPDLKDMVSLTKNAFSIDFESPLRIQDGDTLILSLLI